MVQMNSKVDDAQVYMSTGVRWLEDAGTECLMVMSMSTAGLLGCKNKLSYREFNALLSYVYVTRRT